MEQKAIVQNAFFVKAKITKLYNQPNITSGKIETNSKNFNEIKRLLLSLKIPHKYNNNKFLEYDDSLGIYTSVKNILNKEIKEEFVYSNLKGILRNFWREALKGPARERGRDIIIMDLTNFNGNFSGIKPPFGILLIQTIKSTPNFKLIDGKIQSIPRSGIDKDNTFRYVYFFQENKKIYFIYYEKSYSMYFLRWLGVEDDEVLNCESLNLHFYIEKYGYNFKLEMDENDFLEMINSEKIILKEENKIIFPSKIDEFYFNINKIKLYPLKREFKNIRSLIEVIKERKTGIFYLKEIYKNILEKDFNKNKYVFDSKYIESKTEINPKDKATIYKKPILKNYYIESSIKNHYVLFSDFPGIEYSRKFLKEILRKIKDEECINLTHILLPIDDKFMEILPFLRINNKIKLSKHYKLLYNIYKNKEVQRSEIKEIIKLAIIKMLSENNKFHYFISSLFDFNNFIELNYKIGSHIAKLEDDIIEYKKEDILYGRIDKVANHIFSKCIKNKLKSNELKLIIIGYDEKNATVTGIDKGRAGHDHINNVFRKVKSLIPNNKIYLSEPMALPTENNKFILVFYVYKY